MSDTMGLTTRPMGFTLPLGPGPTRRQRDKARAERLGVELPFGWCLVRGEARLGKDFLLTFSMPSVA